MMRFPFTDKWNSFWHIVFGAISIYIPIIIPIFVIYQIIQGTLNDLVIDIFEFFFGYCLVLCYEENITNYYNLIKNYYII